MNERIASEGFDIINGIYNPDEVAALLSIIATAAADTPVFRKTKDLFAIRQFLKAIPEVKEVLFNDALKDLLHRTIGPGYGIVKSIYFDKPEGSNWFVAYHQDLTISVNKKIAVAGFGPWSVKQDQFAVQPPLPILQDNITLRIHLDDTDAHNGALKVIAGSHLKGIYRPETIDWTTEKETTCNVAKGGVMFMKPLLLHASGRTTNQQKRRVVHIEFSRMPLPEGLEWSEYAMM